MKLRSLLLKSLAVSAGCLLSQSLNVHAAAFTPGNLVVLRVGDGSTALAATAAPVALAEFTTAAGQSSPVQSIAIDSTASGLTLTGISTTQGIVTLSPDGSLLTFTGYRKVAGGGNPQTESAATTNRVVGVVNPSGSVNVSTAVTDAYNADAVRGAVTTNGSSFYLSGAGTSASGGIRYVGTAGSATTSVALNNGNTGNPNTRQIFILGGSLFTSSGASNPGIGLYKIGTALPVSGTQTYTGSIPAGSAQYNSFYFANLGSGNNWAGTGFDTVYTADTSGNLIAKWSFNGTSWAASGTIPLTGVANLTGVTSGSTVTLYGTTSTASTGILFSLTDNTGFNGSLTGSPTTLATAGTNYGFRGVAFAPQSPQPDLVVTAAAPTTGSTGVNFDYTLTATNSGTSNATSVAVNFTLPAGLNFVSASGNNGFTGVNNSGVINFTGGTLNAAASATLTVTVNTNTAATYTAAIGAAVIDPANTITESNESNNASTTAVNTSVTMPNTPPSFTTHPANVSIANGATIPLTSVATGSPAPTYQWYVGASGNTSNPINLATSASYTTAALTATTSYWVRATNSQGTADSNTATVTVAPSTNADLSALTLNNGIVSPGFLSSVTSYNSFLADGTSSLTVTPTAAHRNATITVNGTPLASGAASAAISLSEGSNTAISIVVTAQDGSTTKTYSLVPVRAAAPLAAGSIAFTGYNADGNDDLAFVAITALPANTVIHFTDNEWNGQPIGSGGAFIDFAESELVWMAPAGGVVAGTVVSINNVSSAITASVGTAAYSDPTNTGFSNNVDAVYAFQGATRTAAVFLAQISTDTTASIANTGLVVGTNAINLSASSDGAAYIGSRANQSTFAAYLPQVNNIANWTDVGAGDGTTLLPFNTTTFILGSAASLTINDVTVTEGNSGTVTATFTVTRSANTGAFTVDYATADSTATTAGSDYAATSGTLTFTAGGALTDTINVTVNGDTTTEIGGEQFFVNLSNAVSTIGTVTLTDAQGIGTIADDEAVISTPYTHTTRDVLVPNTNTWPSGGITIGGTQFINLGLQGVGRVPANSIDAATGESLGSISDMQVTDFVRNGSSYTGRFHFLPDRGYNAGSIFSNYAARINVFDFTFTPYTSSAVTTVQNQIAMTFAGSTRFIYDHDGNSGTPGVYTTGVLAGSSVSLWGTLIPASPSPTTQSDGTVANRVTVDAEGLILDRRPGKAGSGWVGDEYGAYIYHFNASKQIDGQLLLPQALVPHSPVGTTNFLADPPVNGRRINQGMEGITQSPDGTRLFALLQSATLQDSGTGNQGRSNARLLVYDISSADAPSDPIAQYVIQLPRIDDTGSLTNGTTVNRNGAQSAIHAISNTQFLVLSREGNGRGAGGTPVFKSVLLADLSSATNFDGTYDAEAAAVAPGGALNGSITPIAWTEALNMIGGLGATPTEVTKFGLNLNTAPGDINSICEKWEALGWVSAGDAANPNDFFLFIGNDNDFISQTGKYTNTAGNLQDYNAGLENDTVVLAYRVRLTGSANLPPFVANNIPNQSAGAGSAFSFAFAANTFVDPENQAITYTASRGDDTALPAWLSFNGSTRTFSGTPSASDIGTLAVKVTATDAATPALSGSATFTLTVNPTVSIASASIAEGNSGTTILNLAVTRSVTTTEFTVNFAVTSGTATPGTDYATLAPGTLTFTAGGAATQNIAITVNGDTTIESNENVLVTLSSIVNSNGTTTLGTAAGTGTITNDDVVPNSFPSNGKITSTVKGSINLNVVPLSPTNGTEIPAFDPVSQRAFASANSGIRVINLTNPATPAYITTIVPTSLGIVGLNSNDVSSVTVRKASGANPSVLAAAIISSPKSAPGYVIFLNPATGALLGSTLVGPNPDHIAFSPDGTKLLVANEGELDAVNGVPLDVVTNDNTVGSVSIISVPATLTGVPTSLPTTTADFTSYDSQAAALTTAGVRIFQGGKPSTDFEPEYFAISADSTKAMVTLQEANAVATLDIATATFTSVVPLGKKNFAGGRHDFSDRDGLTAAGAATTLVNPTTGNPVFGLYMPDAVAAYSAGGQTYFITANEGDDRNDFFNPDETTTVGVATGYVLDPIKFPNAAALKNQASLGRLTVCNSLGLRGDTDDDGDIDEILSYGGRSFSILNSAGVIIWDSGDMIENIVASQFPANFDDGRSRSKGPEPEGVTIATLGSRTYAFIGLERSHMTLMFDVTNPAAVTFAGGLVRTGDLNPEGLVVVSAADSPTGKPLLLQASEVSQTLTVFELNQSTDYTLQVLHYYGESGLLGIQTAPIMGAMIDRFDDQYTNTIVVGEGDSFIPGPWLIAGADPVFNNLLHTTSPVNSGTAGALGSVSTFTAAATTTAVPFARADIAIMNAFGTTVSALGNHEFDLGSPVLASAVYPATTTGTSAVGNWVGAKFPLISANLDFTNDTSLKIRADTSLGGSGSNAPNVSTASLANLEVNSLNMIAKIAPYAIKTLNGQRIGFVGATTWDLLSKSSPNGAVPKDDANSATSDLQEVAAYVQAAVNALQALGVNKIVMVDQLDELQRNKDLAPLVSGIDIMVAGGGHERMGDSTDVPVGFNGHDANFIADAYPITTAGLDGRPTLIVTTDTEYTYLGRLVADFDADGVLILPNLNPAINGAYASTEANLQTAYATSNSATTIIAGSTIGSQVKTIIDAINNVVVTKDGNVYGYTNVYLEGDRVFGRTQEVNLGNITADANAWKARSALSLGLGDAVFSLKNGGGIRASLGSVLANGTKVAPIANPLTGKLAGGISQLDIENALRFDNKLMVFDATPLGLKNILEFASGLSSGPTAQSGGYAQVGNIRFSYNSALTSGSRLRSAALVNEAGQIVAKIVENGAVLSTAPATIECVALSFTANGGDSYPIKANADNFRYILTTGTLSAPIDEALDFTAAANVPANVLGEQKAFQDFLAARHPNLGTAYNVADTAVALDTRIQQLAFRTDTVLSGPATFASWLASNGFTGTLGGDSDGDGVPDSLEYFFNTSPNSGSDLANLPTVVKNGNDLEFRFTYLNSTIFSGSLQCSEDLTSWVNATPGLDYEVITETVNGVQTAVRYRIITNNNRKFFKISVPAAP